MHVYGSSSRLYWFCQIGGWSAFIIYQLSLYYFVLKIPQTSMLLLNGLVNILLGILVTHGYRMYIHLMGWLELPLKLLIPRVMLGVISMAVILSAINIPLDKLMFPGLEITYHFSSIYGILSNWSKYILVWALIYHLFQYYRKSLESEKKRYRLEARMRDAEFRQLKAQLNPHFLFNSLNSIRALVETDPQRARTAITQLSELLRSALKTGDKKVVRLSDELHTVQDYLSLEQVRFDKRLQYILDIPEDTLSLEVPPMMIQTLVENAIKHGITKRKEGGTVHIRTRKLPEGLWIEIRNTGTYDPEVAAHSEGYGLSNTQQRLALQYNGKAKFSIANTAYEEVQIQILIPI